MPKTDHRPDMSIPCGEGLVNLRVGAVIVKDHKILMAGNPKNDYLYSVGGRIKFGETAEEAVVREVLEETGTMLAVDRLAFIQENYFYGDAPGKKGKLIYEVAMYFLMQVPEDFEPVKQGMAEGGETEWYQWVAPDTPQTLYPDFFRTDALHPAPGVTYYVNDERLSREPQSP